MKRLPLLVVLGLIALAIALPMSGGMLGFGEASPAPSGIAAGPSPSAGASGTPTASAEAPPSADPAATPEAHARRDARPDDGPAGRCRGRAGHAIPCHRDATPRAPKWPRSSPARARATRRWSSSKAEADAILTAVDASRPADADHLVLVPDAAALAKDLAKHRKRLAFLRADAVTPAVRALAWGGRTLFGVDRVTTAGEWRLHAQLPAAAADAAFDPAETWTMFAGGDILLDRGVYQTVRIKGKGVDFPFDGGTAEITGHTCCSGFGWEQPVTRRTGNGGAMRELIKGADIAIANFENPAPNRVRWHTSGTVFSADPGIIDGLVNAGIDYVSLANNHIGDAGDAGILQTIDNLEERGLAYSGAGKDSAAARKPAILEAGGVKVAVLGYDAIASYYSAGDGEAGSSRLTLSRARNDIKRARKGGADIVIVFPHWGTEYRRTPFSAQQKLARDIIDAGADMIIGNHAHYAAAMEVYDGKPIWYALGNFIFDQTWSEPTMEGITLELTFHGKDLMQARMRPHIILDKAQPNFLDPAGDGRVVMGQIYDASKGILPW